MKKEMGYFNQELKCVGIILVTVGLIEKEVGGGGGEVALYM